MIEVIRRILEIISIVFVFYMLFYSAFQFLAVTTSTLELHRRWQRRRYHNHLPDDYYLPVSILVPAYNELESIMGTILSLAALKYNIYEIIVVDDGSSDGMSDYVLSEMELHKVSRPLRMQVPCKSVRAIYEGEVNGIPLTLIVKNNGGKADALNAGINAARYPYVVTMDADSMLEEEALERIISPMLEDDAVVAVGGLVRPSNDLQIVQGHMVRPTMPKNILACMQVLEYDRSFLSLRLLLDKFNANLIVSGAFGLFKKEILVSIGGFETNTIGEDMEVIVRIHTLCLTQNRPYRIRYEPEAVCWTQVPEKVSDLRRQRRRWHLGLFQVMKKYLSMASRFDVGPAMSLAFNYYIFYELLSPFIEVAGIGITILSVLVGLVNVPFMLLFYLIYVVYGWMLALLAFFSRVHITGIRVTVMDGIKAVFYCLFENTFLRTILLYTRLTAFVGYKKNRLAWNKIKRTKVFVEKGAGKKS